MKNVTIPNGGVVPKIPDIDIFKKKVATAADDDDEDNRKTKQKKPKTAKKQAKVADIEPMMPVLKKVNIFFIS